MSKKVNQRQPVDLGIDRAMLARIAIGFVAAVCLPIGTWGLHTVVELVGQVASLESQVGQVERGVNSIQEDVRRIQQHLLDRSKAEAQSGTGDSSLAWLGGSSAHAGAPAQRDARFDWTAWNPFDSLSGSLMMIATLLVSYWVMRTIVRDGDLEPLGAVSWLGRSRSTEDQLKDLGDHLAQGGGATVETGNATHRTSSQSRKLVG